MGLKQDYEEKLERLRDEKNNISEEFNKIRHKAKVRIKMAPTTHHVRIDLTVLVLIFCPCVPLL